MVMSGHREPNFRFGDDGTKSIFEPISRLDRSLRPDYWGTTVILN